MNVRMNGFIEDERGQDLTEYTLLIVFVMLAILGLAAGSHNSIAGIVSTTNANLAAGASAAGAS
jgi:Flp pilus assembly pilin Flp